MLRPLRAGGLVVARRRAAHRRASSSASARWCSSCRSAPRSASASPTTATRPCGPRRRAAPVGAVRRDRRLPLRADDDGAHQRQDARAHGRRASASCGPPASTSRSASRCCARCSVKTVLFGIAGSFTGGTRAAARRAVAAVGRGEPRPARLHRQHAGRQGLGNAGPGGQVPAGIRPGGETACSGERDAAAGGGVAAGLGPDHLLAPGADADERDRHADEVGDEGQVVARGLREVGLLAGAR